MSNTPTAPPKPPAKPVAPAAAKAPSAPPAKAPATADAAAFDGQVVYEPTGCLNKVMLIGFIGRPPDYKKTDKSAVCHLSLVTKEASTIKGKRQEHTEQHWVVAFGKLADICNKELRDGQQIYVEGKIKRSTWKGKDGAEHSATQIIAHNVRKLAPAS